MKAYHVKVEWLYKGRYPKAWEGRADAASIPAAAGRALRDWKRTLRRESVRQATIRITTA